MGSFSNPKIPFHMVSIRFAMKRAMRWNDDETSSSSSSDSESDEDDNSKKKSKLDSKPHKPSKVESGKQKKSGAAAFDALKRYGYRGGLSILNVPAPKEEAKQDWSWSSGKEKPEVEEESYPERQKTRYAVKDGELLEHAITQKDREKKGIMFSQKEKRKRELGQATRGKNYVEEEKRMLRDNGVYSGFDS